MKRMLLFTAVPLALAVSVRTLYAQSDSKNVYVSARAGAYNPVSDLFGFSYDGYRGAQRTWQHDIYPSVGLGLEVRFPPQALSLQASLLYVPRIDVAASACGPGGFCLAVLLPDLQARILVGTADLVIRFPTSNPGVAPYLLTGFGIKHYSGALSDTGITLHFGMGAEVVASERAGVTFQVGDYLSWFNGFDVGASSQTQHDLTATFGVRYGWF
jgi:hypothetical protein